MDAVSEVVTVPVTDATTVTTSPASTDTFNVNQSNNNTQNPANKHTASGSLLSKIASNVISNSGGISLNIGGSSNSNSSCSSSSTSSNSSGYGSSTTTPTNNYDLQNTTPTTTPVPTTTVANTEHIIPVATVAAVTPFFNEAITTHNLETQHHHHHHHHHAQQSPEEPQQQQHHVLQTHHQQYSQSHLQPNLQHQQHHQYLTRQQYYSPYDYQQSAPTHNLSATSAPYNMIIPGPYEIPPSNVAPAFGTSQYKSSSSSTVGSTYDRSPLVKPNVGPCLQQTQPQHTDHQQQSKTINPHFSGLLGSNKPRSSSSFISSSNSTNTSKPQAMATPFYANPFPFYDNYKHKPPLEYPDAYINSSVGSTATYQQQQKYYAAAKSQLKDASYGSPAALSSTSAYSNPSNVFSGATGGLNLSSASYDKYMYPHTPATGYTATGHLGNETPAEVSNYRKSIVGSNMNSPSWPWGIDYASGNSRSIPPPTSHLPTATVAPTHATHLTQNPSVLARDPFYVAHDKYVGKYDKYSTSSYPQTYVSPPTANRNMWSSTPHATNLTQFSDRHLLASGPPALPAHGPHAASYFSNNHNPSLNSRQTCCSQPYQSQSCYYPVSHPVQPRLPHNQNNTVAPPPPAACLPGQQTLGQSPHLTALTASCKYGGVFPDYANTNKMKTSNDLYLNSHHYDISPPPSHNFGYPTAHNSQQLYNSNAHQSMAHAATPTPLLTNDPYNANPTSYTNDLNLTTSNFDNYHTHVDNHPREQPLTGVHNSQPAPVYGPTVAKRALLDYRKPTQPQPPPAVPEETYPSLTSRDHYNQHELLNTPETTTTFEEYEVHQSNTADQSREVLSDSIAGVAEDSTKNLSLRDFIANWNDDEDEYQNNEEISFDQSAVINEVLQTAPIDQETAAEVVTIQEVKVIKPAIHNVHVAETPKEAVDDPLVLLNQAGANQYVNLPDIVIDIKKSNNVNNSITTPTTSPKLTQTQVAHAGSSLNLTDFDVEKELDELNLKKPLQQEKAKESNDIKDSKSDSTPQLSPDKNINSQLNFEDLNLEPPPKTVLNGISARPGPESNEQYLKDIEGYESSCSRHSNESAFEKEYETFINKITSESSSCPARKREQPQIEAEKETEFDKNVQDFSKFYKRKRKLKEAGLKSSLAENQNKKKIKIIEPNKINNSNFPQVYTKKCRNRLLQINRKQFYKPKPLSAFYKIIYFMRRQGLQRKKKVREFMSELKDKHLPLIKRQFMKNYTPGTNENTFVPQTLKALCIRLFNTEEFRQSSVLSKALQPDNNLDAEEKHICTDPTCETCEVIKSLMETENFEATAYCTEATKQPMTILDDSPNTTDLNFPNEEAMIISNTIEDDQFIQANLSALPENLLLEEEGDNFQLRIEQNTCAKVDQAEMVLPPVFDSFETLHQSFTTTKTNSTTDTLEGSTQPAAESSFCENLESKNHCCQPDITTTAKSETITLLNESNISFPLKDEKHSKATINEGSDSDDSSSSDSESESSSSGNESSDSDTGNDSDESEINDLNSKQSAKVERPQTENAEAIQKEKSALSDKNAEQHNSGSSPMPNVVNNKIMFDNEKVPNSPQRIVIRITKSLSPNEQSLRVENISAKPLKPENEYDDHTGSDQEDDEDFKQKKTDFLSMQGEDFVSQQPFEEQTDLDHAEDHAGTAKKLVTPLKLVLRGKEYLRVDSVKKSLKLRPKYDTSTESESENEEFTKKKSKLIKLSRTQDHKNVKDTKKMKLKFKNVSDNDSNKITPSQISSPARIEEKLESSTDNFEQSADEEYNSKRRISSQILSPEKHNNRFEEEYEANIGNLEPSSDEGCDSKIWASSQTLSPKKIEEVFETNLDKIEEFGTNIDDFKTSARKEGDTNTRTSSQTLSPKKIEEVFEANTDNFEASADEDFNCNKKPTSQTPSPYKLEESLEDGLGANFDSFEASVDRDNNLIKGLSKIISPEKEFEANIDNLEGGEDKGSISNKRALLQTFCHQKLEENFGQDFRANLDNFDASVLKESNSNKDIEEAFESNKDKLEASKVIESFSNKNTLPELLSSETLQKQLKDHTGIFETSGDEDSNFNKKISSQTLIPAKLDEPSKEVITKEELKANFDNLETISNKENQKSVETSESKDKNQQENEEVLDSNLDHTAEHNIKPISDEHRKDYLFEYRSENETSSLTEFPSKYPSQGSVDQNPQHSNSSPKMNHFTEDISPSDFLHDIEVENASFFAVLSENPDEDVPENLKDKSSLEIIETYSLTGSEETEIYSFLDSESCNSSDYDTFKDDDLTKSIPNPILISDDESLEDAADNIGLKIQSAKEIFSDEEIKTDSKESDFSQKSVLYENKERMKNSQFEIVKKNSEDLKYSIESLHVNKCEGIGGTKTGNPAVQDFSDCSYSSEEDSDEEVILKSSAQQSQNLVEDEERHLLDLSPVNSERSESCKKAFSETLDKTLTAVSLQETFTKDSALMQIKSKVCKEPLSFSNLEEEEGKIHIISDEKETGTGISQIEENVNLQQPEGSQKIPTKTAEIGILENNFENATRDKFLIQEHNKITNAEANSPIAEENRNEILQPCSDDDMDALEEFVKENSANKFELCLKEIHKTKISHEMADNLEEAEKYLIQGDNKSCSPKTCASTTEEKNCNLGEPAAPTDSICGKINLSTKTKAAYKAYDLQNIAEEEDLSDSETEKICSNSVKDYEAKKSIDIKAQKNHSAASVNSEDEQKLLPAEAENLEGEFNQPRIHGEEPEDFSVEECLNEVEGAKDNIDRTIMEATTEENKSESLGTGNIISIDNSDESVFIMENPTALENEKATGIGKTGVDGTISSQEMNESASVGTKDSNVEENSLPFKCDTQTIEGNDPHLEDFVNISVEVNDINHITEVSNKKTHIHSDESESLTKPEEGPTTNKEYIKELLENLDVVMEDVPKSMVEGAKCQETLGIMEGEYSFEHSKSFDVGKLSAAPSEEKSAEVILENTSMTRKPAQPKDHVVESSLSCSFGKGDEIASEDVERYEESEVNVLRATSLSKCESKEALEVSKLEDEEPAMESGKGTEKKYPKKEDANVTMENHLEEEENKSDKVNIQESLTLTDFISPEIKTNKENFNEVLKEEVIDKSIPINPIIECKESKIAGSPNRIEISSLNNNLSQIARREKENVTNNDLNVEENELSTTLEPAKLTERKETCEPRNEKHSSIEDDKEEMVGKEVTILTPTKSQIETKDQDEEIIFKEKLPLKELPEIRNEAANEKNNTALEEVSDKETAASECFLQKPQELKLDPVVHRDERVDVASKQNCEVSNEKKNEKSKYSNEGSGVEHQNLCRNDNSNNDPINCLKENEKLQSSKESFAIEISRKDKPEQHTTEEATLQPQNAAATVKALGKSSITADELSADFYGFKNQSSFEDESEDFHGFEDLEEVERIRQEIENLNNDDSAANDGFLNNLNLSPAMNKATISAFSDCAGSEINVLEALEKELSQHQLEMDVADEGIETEKDFQTNTVKVISKNDIEHIKQMLESDEETPEEDENKLEIMANTSKDKSVENKNVNIAPDRLSSVIPKLSDLCRAALNSSLNSSTSLAQQQTETSTVPAEHDLSVEEALAEMFRQAGVLLSDSENFDNNVAPTDDSDGHDVLLINLQEILSGDNNDVYVLQCDMNENVLNVVEPSEEHEREALAIEAATTERVNTVQIIVDTHNSEPQIHIISSDSESEVIILSDDESEISCRKFKAREETVTIPFINDDEINNSDDNLFDISTIHHEEIVPDNLAKFLRDEFYKYLHEKYVQRSISKYYHAHRILKKYKRRFTRRQ